MSFLENRAVPLGSSALPSVRGTQLSRCPVIGAFPLELVQLPDTNARPGPCFFCFLTEDMFAFAMKKMTSVVNFHSD